MVETMPHVPRVLATAPPTNQTDLAYLTIKRLIINLEIPPGGSFTEPQMAAVVGTSKTPVREALVRLQREGFVEALPRSGYRVTPVTLKDVRDLCDFRTILEAEAAERAALRGISEAELVRMDELLSRVYDPADPVSVDEYVRASLEFDSIIANACGNERLAAAIADVFDQLERVLYVTLRQRAWSAAAAAQRRDILEAIRARDPRRARKAMLVRTEESQRFFLGALMESASVLSANVVVDVAGRP